MKTTIIKVSSSGKNRKVEFIDDFDGCFVLSEECHELVYHLLKPHLQADDAEDTVLVA